MLRDIEVLSPIFRQLVGITTLSASAATAKPHNSSSSASAARTSISAALGMARGKLHRGEDGIVIALIGDGAMTAGMETTTMTT